MKCRIQLLSELCRPKMPFKFVNVVPRDGTFQGRNFGSNAYEISKMVTGAETNQTHHSTNQRIDMTYVHSKHHISQSMRSFAMKPTGLYYRPNNISRPSIIIIKSTQTRKICMLQTGSFPSRLSASSISLLKRILAKP